MLRKCKDCGEEFEPHNIADYYCDACDDMYTEEQEEDSEYD